MDRIFEWINALRPTRQHSSNNTETQTDATLPQHNRTSANTAALHHFTKKRKINQVAATTPTLSYFGTNSRSQPIKKQRLTTQPEEEHTALLESPSPVIVPKTRRLSSFPRNSTASQQPRRSRATSVPKAKITDTPPQTATKESNIANDTKDNVTPFKSPIPLRKSRQTGFTSSLITKTPDQILKKMNSNRQSYQSINHIHNSNPDHSAQVDKDASLLSPYIDNDDDILLNNAVVIKERLDDLNSSSAQSTKHGDDQIDGLSSLMSVLDLRQKSKLYQLEDKQKLDEKAVHLYPQLATLFIDEFCIDILTDIYNDQVVPVDIYSNILQDLIEEVVFEVKEFIPLTETHRQIVYRSLSTKYSEQEVLAEEFAIDLTRGKVSCLQYGKWLNDEVINFYLNLVKKRNETCKKFSQPKCYIQSTFFYTKLTERGQYNYSLVKRWTRKVDLFQFDKIIVPIHLGVHWTLAVINLQDKRFEYYDSMGDDNMKCLQMLQRFLEDESLDKRKIKLDTSDFQFYIPKDNPQQNNCFDCGVFMCKAANFIAQGRDLVFSQGHMKYFRERMVVELVSKNIL